jgi:hypothetical protein
MREIRYANKILAKYLKVKGHIGDLDIDGTIILRLNSKK